MLFKTNNQINFILFTILAFCALLLPQAFMKGMFMDGMIYGSIARNLSIGQGSFWQLQFSETLLSDFHEHPPLAFWLQSLLFDLTAGAFFTERLYAIVLAAASAFFISRIYRRISPNPETWWLPVLLWITTERVFWCFGNNMLENTMSLFSLTAVYTAQLSAERKGLSRSLLLILSAMLVFLGFLSKGLPALFALVVPLCIQRKTLRERFSDNLLLVLFFVCIVILFFILSPVGSRSISEYLGTQVSNSVQGRDRVGERLPFVLGFFQQSLHIIIVCILLLLFHKTGRIPLAFPRSSASFLTIGLAAFIPLLVSPKLSFYYLVPSMPYFAIAAANWIAPSLVSLTDRIGLHSKFRNAAFLLLFCGIMFTVWIAGINAGKAARDENNIRLAENLAVTLGNNKIVSLDPSLYEDWSLIAALQRYGQISVLREKGKPGYYLQHSSDVPPQEYVETDMRLSGFRLLRKLP